MEKFIRMNVDMAPLKNIERGQKTKYLFEKYQTWPEKEAPEIVQRWAKNKDIAYTTQVCSYVDKNGKLLSDEPVEKQAQDSDPLRGLNETTKSLYTVCKGVKKDGTPCKSRMLIGDTGYCRAHQHQAQAG